MKLVFAAAIASLTLTSVAYAADASVYRNPHDDAVCAKALASMHLTPRDLARFSWRTRLDDCEGLIPPALRDPSHCASGKMMRGGGHSGGPLAGGKIWWDIAKEAPNTCVN